MSSHFSDHGSQAPITRQPPYTLSYPQTAQNTTPQRPAIIYPNQQHQLMQPPPTGGPYGPIKVTQKNGGEFSYISASTQEPKIPTIIPPKDNSTDPPASAPQRPQASASSSEGNRTDPASFEQPTHARESLIAAEQVPFAFTGFGVPSAGTDLDINVHSDPDMEGWLLGPLFVPKNPPT